jgi:glycolate oxidase
MDVVAQLTAALSTRVSVAPAMLMQVRSDQSGHTSRLPPLCVVLAESVSDVQETMRIASRTQTPVVVRGAGTGVAGGSIGGAGEIVLSVEKLNRVLSINTDDLYAVVEPGVINGDFNDQLRPEGLWFAPDPASRAISSIGGNIATNAGGLLCAKYGVTGDAVLGLSVVMANGDLIEMGHRTVKGVTGLDLTALMVGSEGILGVIVGATVRIRRKVPGPVPTVAAYFDDVSMAAHAAAAITSAGVQPSIMELMDPASVVAVQSYLGEAIARADEAHLLVQTDGPGALEEAEQVLAVIEACGGRAELVASEEGADRLLRIRRSIHPALAALGTNLIEDVSVPRSALPAMFDVIARVSRDYGLLIPTVAHAGDGNLHPNFIFSGPDAPPEVWEAAGELFTAALQLGGTLTGEHGVGILKSRWLRDELGDAQYALQQRIKLAFDPAGILNPGKVFEAPKLGI